MKETGEYTIIYDGCGHREMFLKADGILSFVEETCNANGSTYLECMVRSEVIEAQLENPALSGGSFTGKMTMLFGNYDGLDRFHQFCDDRGIDTMTLTWQ